ACQLGFPASRTSSPAISCCRSRRRRAISLRMRPRSIGLRSRQSGSAASAALTAASTSRASPRAISPSGFPVAGFVVSRWRPLPPAWTARRWRCCSPPCSAPPLPARAGRRGALHARLEEAPGGGVEEEPPPSRRTGPASGGGLVRLAHPPGKRDLLLGRGI